MVLTMRDLPVGEGVKKRMQTQYQVLRPPRSMPRTLKLDEVQPLGPRQPQWFPCMHCL